MDCFAVYDIINVFTWNNVILTAGERKSEREIDGKAFAPVSQKSWVQIL